MMRNFGERKTLCKIYSGRTLKPLGHVVLRLLQADDPLVLSHSFKEAEYKLRMLKTGGKESIAMSPQELNEKSAILLKYVTNGHVELKLAEFSYREKKKLRKLSMESLKTAMSELAYELPGSEHQQKRIINKAWGKILDFKAEIDTENELLAEEEKKKKDEEKEKLAEQEKQFEQEEKERIEHEQKELINAIIPGIIEELKLDTDQEKPPSRILIRHVLARKGVLKEFITFAQGELELMLFSIIENQPIVEQEQIKLYEVDEKERFIFHEELFLEKLRTNNNRIQKSSKLVWGNLVDLYIDKQQGLQLDQLIEKYNFSRPSILKYYKMVQGKIADELGIQYEQFRYEQLKRQTPGAEVKLAKSNSKDPDITIIFENMIDFYSLKVRKLTSSKASETLLVHEAFRPELSACKAAINAGKIAQVYIDFYNVFNNTRTLQPLDVTKVTQKSRVLLKYTGEIIINY